MIRDLKDPRADAVIRRHERYWRNEPDARELFQLQQASPLVDTANPHTLEPPPPLDMKKYATDTARSYDENGLLTDDLFRMLGTGITSEALVGCRIVVRAGTHWAEPCFTDWHQLDGYRVQDSLWYQRLLENTQRAVEAVGSDTYPFCCMAFRGAVDMAEAMMKGGRLIDAIIDHPQELKDLLARITDITIETALAHAPLLPMYDGGQFNSYGIWTPGRTVTFTVDGACLFSPACYEEFFLPCDIRLCEALETPFVHTHAAARQHFSAWTEISNLGMQCVIDQAYLPEGRNLPIGPQLPDLLSEFETIRERKSLMLYGFWDESMIDLSGHDLPPGGCAITGMVEDLDAIRRRYLPHKGS
ncbi:MAG: hypothetical protein HOH43_05505 [Candidatus Latescibacteria bacterium]|jgi:hypothetical protein|nr:hypothetical protein [Candidatus Latescibacterota bacterium]